MQHREVLAEPVGQVQTASVGAPIATLRKEKDLPNIYGNADLFGRKVDTGFTKLIFMGRSSDGSAIVERSDVDVHSTATTMSRTPGYIVGQSTGSIAGTQRGFSGFSQGTVQGMSPIGESTTVLPPQSTTFTVPEGKTLSIAQGYTVEFLTVESHQVTYRISSAQH